MTDIYYKLADWLEYPDDRLTAPAIGDDSDSCANFIAAVDSLSLSDLQEIYARTFDLNPVCALEIGYHLFGENYKRGEFLANLRETEAPFALGQEHQLPDYLPVLLRLLTKLDEQELRSSLITECLIPALEKILTSLKETDNPYRYLLDAVRTTLQSEVPVVCIEAPGFRMRASLPVLNHNADLPSGYAARGAVAAPRHRDEPLQSHWGPAPEFRGVAPDSKSIRPEGHRPSAHQAAEPLSEAAPR